jgi:hypothetical protein
MRTLPALLILAALTPASALAGGVGLFGSAGVHGTKAYYYNSNLQQGVDIQQRPDASFGGEVIIGDKDDRISGIMRLYSNTDFNPTEPTLEGVTKADAIYPTYDETTRTDLIATMGVQWGLYGEPDGRQLILTTLFGSAFATLDNLEYAIGEVGIGGTMMLSENLQLAGTLNGNIRYRKRITGAGGAYLGIRYMFD